MNQVPDDQLVAVGGMLGQRPDHRHAAPFGPVHGRDVDERTVGTDLGQHGLLLAQRQAEVPEPGLAVADEGCQGDGGTHVRERVVRLRMGQAVGGTQMFQLEGGAAVVVAGPFDALGAQGGRGPHHVQQIPSAAAVAPFPVVGRSQRAPQQVARHFVVEADGVVAHADGAAGTQLGQHRIGKAVFGQPPGQALLRQDAGQQAGLGVRQVVGGRLAVQHHRLADLVQVEVGADAGKLRRPVKARVAPEGFVVVPEEACFAHVG